MRNEDIGTILAVKQDKDNRFWLGTSSGLYVYDRLSERLDTVDQDRFIGVTSLAFDRSDRLWISTHEGLYAYVPDEKRVIVFGESDGVFTREFLPEPALRLLPVIFIFLGWKGWLGYGPTMTFMRKRIFL